MKKWPVDVEIRLVESDLAAFDILLQALDQIIKNNDATATNDRAERPSA